jgi:hypothetical protein
MCRACRRCKGRGFQDEREIEKAVSHFILMAEKLDWATFED